MGLQIKNKHNNLGDRKMQSFMNRCTKRRRKKVGISGVQMYETSIRKAEKI